MREIFIHSITFRFSAFMVEFLRARGRLSTDPKRGLAQEANDFMIAVAFLDQHELAAFRIGALHGENLICIAHDRDLLRQFAGREPKLLLSCGSNTPVGRVFNPSMPYHAARMG